MLKQPNISYCGLDCTTCILYQKNSNHPIENPVITQNLEPEPLFPNDLDFETFLTKLQNQYGPCEGCVNGSGFLNCLVHTCAQSKGLSTCADCPKLEHCDLIKADFWKMPVLLTHKK